MVTFKNLIIGILILTTIDSFGQKGYKPGVIYMKDGTVLTGYIKHKFGSTGGINLAGNLNFREALDKKKSSYYPKKVSAFTLEKDSFVVVDRVAPLPDHITSPMRRDYAKVLQKGPINLLEHKVMLDLSMPIPNYIVTYHGYKSTFVLCDEDMTECLTIYRARPLREEILAFFESDKVISELMNTTKPKDWNMPTLVRSYNLKQGKTEVSKK